MITRMGGVLSCKRREYSPGILDSFAKVKPWTHHDYKGIRKSLDWLVNYFVKTDYSELTLMTLRHREVMRPNHNTQLLLAARIKICAFPQHKCEQYIVIYLQKCLTCKKASEEFIDSSRQFFVTVMGIEIHFPANGDTVHVNLHEQAFSTSFSRLFTDYFTRDRAVMSLGGWISMAVADSEIFPERSQWRPPDNWSWSSPIRTIHEGIKLHK